MHSTNLLTRVFYAVKPIIPRWLQLFARQKLAKRILSIHADVWPINNRASKLPQDWEGWPDSRQFAFILSHDVETGKGCNSVLRLIEIEKAFGFRSSFSFVPERYDTPIELIHLIKSEGFEVAVHGLKHDGKLFSSKKMFLERAKRINFYINKWGSKGFYSPSMHHNLEYIHDLDILYDQSTFDTDPFEPQPIGVDTIFPFIVENKDSRRRYIELPYTLPQDHTVFIMLKNVDIGYWQKKLDWIAEKGGMALLKTHPDYMDFNSENLRNHYPVEQYIKFLEYVKKKYGGMIWHALPLDVARFWDCRYGPVDNS